MIMHVYSTIPCNLREDQLICMYLGKSFQQLGHDNDNSIGLPKGGTGQTTMLQFYVNLCSRDSLILTVTAKLALFHTFWHIQACDI